jgi:heme exporter protein B
MASTVFILYLSLEESPEAQIWNSMFWLIQLFVCVNAVAKSFMQDSRGRMLYYLSLSSPVEYIVSKLLYNLMLMMAMSLISLSFMLFFLSNPLKQTGIFTGITLLGGAGLSLTFTLMSAIASKTRQNASLIAILGFPVILPQLLLLMRLSGIAFEEHFQSGAITQLVVLLSLMNVLVIILGIVLFPFLWKD